MNEHEYRCPRCGRLLQFQTGVLETVKILKHCPCVENDIDRLEKYDRLFKPLLEHIGKEVR